MDVPPEREDPTLPEARRALAFGPITFALAADDAAVVDWLTEYLGPWFAPTRAAGEVQITVSSAGQAFAELARRCPLDAPLRPCFAHDQQVIALPAWRTTEGIVAADLRRSCFVIFSRLRIGIIGDPTTRRWRFTLQSVLHEVAAARMRRTELDLHAAAVEAGGKAIVIVGPKRAGKTTLSFHLMRSARCRWIANDRTFAGPSGVAFTALGMPTAVKIHPSTLADFPELRRGLRDLDRPYLHTVGELAGAIDGEEIDGSTEFALSPPQLMRQLKVKGLPSAPAGAIAFPEIRNDVERWTVEELEPPEVSAGIRANLYGRLSGRREPTLFEELDGGTPASPNELADALSESVPGFRVLLGRHAYAEPGLVARLLESVAR